MVQRGIERHKRFYRCLRVVKSGVQCNEASGAVACADYMVKAGPRAPALKIGEAGESVQEPSPEGGHVVQHVGAGGLGEETVVWRYDHRVLGCGKFEEPVWPPGFVETIADYEASAVPEDYDRKGCRGTMFRPFDDFLGRKDACPDRVLGDCVVDPIFSLEMVELAVFGRRHVVLGAWEGSESNVLPQGTQSHVYTCLYGGYPWYEAQR